MWVRAVEIPHHEGDGAHDFTSHPCKRDCRLGTAKTCFFTLHLSSFVTMGRACYNCPYSRDDCFKPGCILGSGSQRSVLVANKMLPGPSIEVCKGDRVIVEVMNMMQNGEASAIHWHGLHQRGTQHMDGIGMVSQCPIFPMQSFTYEFMADDVGTHFWHSHMGTQRSDGLCGPLIIRDKDDPNRNLYDHDDLQPVVMQDWHANEPFVDRFSTFHFGYGSYRPEYILVNGIWASSMNMHGFVGPLPPFPNHVPPFRYNLHSKMRYRFRLINNAYWNVPIRVSIEGHNLIVISADSTPIFPVVTKSVTLLPAERFDIVPYPDCFNEDFHKNTNGVFRIKAQGLGDAYGISTAQSFAEIHYNVKPSCKTVDEACGQKLTVNDEINYWNWAPFTMGHKTGLKVTELEAVTPLTVEEPTFRYLIQFDFEKVQDPRLLPLEMFRDDANNVISSMYKGYFVTPRMNKITNMMPPVPILTQWREIPLDMFCNAEKRKCPPEEFCKCIHLVHIPLGCVVEIVMVDSSKGGHSMNHGEGESMEMEGGMDMADHEMTMEGSHHGEMEMEGHSMHFLLDGVEEATHKGGSEMEMNHGSMVMNDHAHHDMKGAGKKQEPMEDHSSMVHLHHPMHIHGTSFQVVGMGTSKDSPEDIFRMVRNGTISVKPGHGAVKDVVGVPMGGYTIIRFKADNPGPWPFHCHIGNHMVS